MPRKTRTECKGEYWRLRRPGKTGIRFRAALRAVPWDRGGHRIRMDKTTRRGSSKRFPRRSESCATKTSVARLGASNVAEHSTARPRSERFGGCCGRGRGEEVHPPTGEPQFASQDKLRILQGN